MAPRKKKKSTRAPKEAPRTAGWKRLVEWKDTSETNTLTSLARRVGVKQPSAYAWFKCETRPVGDVRILVSKIIECAADDWLTEAELVELEGLRAGVNKRSRGKAA
jgi:hypothetical protein